MKHLEKYTGTKTYMFPNSGLGTPDEVLRQFPAVQYFTHVVETDQSGEVMYALENLSAMRARFNVSSELTEDEAIIAIEDLINTPAPEPSPSAEERIAAALEYQNLTSMEDIIV